MSHQKLTVTSNRERDCKSLWLLSPFRRRTSLMPRVVIVRFGSVSKYLGNRSILIVLRGCMLCSLIIIPGSFYCVARKGPRGGLAPENEVVPLFKPRDPPTGSANRHFVLTLCIVISMHGTMDVQCLHFDVYVFDPQSLCVSGVYSVIQWTLEIVVFHPSVGSGNSA